MCYIISHLFSRTLIVCQFGRSHRGNEYLSFLVRLRPNFDRSNMEGIAMRTVFVLVALFAISILSAVPVMAQDEDLTLFTSENFVDGFGKPVDEEITI